MRTYWNTHRGLRTLENWEPNCWVQVTCPTQDDIDYLENTLHIPDYFLMDIADTDERARYEFDDGWILIILRIPYVKEVRSRTPIPPFRWVSSSTRTCASRCATSKPT